MEVTREHHMPAALPCERTREPIKWEAMWTPELVWTFCKRKQYRAPAGIRTLSIRTIRSILVAIPTSEVADLLLFVHRRNLAKNRGGAKPTMGISSQV
jgi:hypothetical protein